MARLWRKMSGPRCHNNTTLFGLLGAAEGLHRQKIQYELCLTLLTKTLGIIGVGAHSIKLSGYS